MSQTKKTDPAALAIEELEWGLKSAEGSIAFEWANVQRAQEYVENDQKRLTEALESYTVAVNRKEGLRYALTVLRNHDSA